VSWPPATGALRLAHVDLARRPVDVAPLLAQDLFGPKTGESAEREIRQAPLSAGGFEASPHLIGRQDGGVLMLKAALLQSLHRIAGNHFEVVLTPAEKAPRDAPVIVLRDRRQPRQRSQPRVEFPMTDRVDRVLAMAGDERVEDLPDLEERQAGLLVPGDPQRGAFAERYLRSRRPRPFSCKEPPLLDLDDVGESGFLLFEGIDGLVYCQSSTPESRPSTAFLALRL
jgi:hypothetical protein